MNHFVYEYFMWRIYSSPATTRLTRVEVPGIDWRRPHVLRSDSATESSQPSELIRILIVDDQYGWTIPVKYLPFQIEMIGVILMNEHETLCVLDPRRFASLRRCLGRENCCAPQRFRLNLFRLRFVSSIDAVGNEQAIVYKLYDSCTC